MRGWRAVVPAAILAGAPPPPPLLPRKAGLSPLVGVPLGGALAALVGFLLGLPALRLHGHFLALATLSFGAAVPQVALKWDAVTGGAVGLSPALFPSDRAAYWAIL